MGIRNVDIAAATNEVLLLEILALFDLGISAVKLKASRLLRFSFELLAKQLLELLCEVWETRLIT